MILYTMRENIGIILLWLLALLISAASFIAITNTLPTTHEFLLGHTLYAIPAMSNSFLHIIKFYDDAGPHWDVFFWLLTGLYWAIIITCHYWYFEEREGKYILVIAFFVLVSSVKWLYFAVAIMHAQN